MSTPLDDFCRMILEKAKEKSLNMQNGYVGTEHLLWGLIRSEGNLSRAIREKKLSIEDFLNRIESCMEDYENLSNEPGPQTPRLRKILASAREIAAQAMMPIITEETLIKALFSGGRSTAVRIVESFNLEPEKLISDMDSVKTDIRNKTPWPMPEDVKALPPLASQPIPRQYYPPQGIIVLSKQGIRESRNRSGEKQSKNHMGYPGSISDEGGIINRDLTDLAFAVPDENYIVGREKEIDEICLCLKRATSSNPVLVGEKGIGKTSVVEGLAFRIARGKIQDFLKNVKILELTRSRFIQFLTSSKDSEKKFKEFLKESPFPGTILFLSGIIEILDDERLPWAVINAINNIRDAVEEGRIRVIISTNQRVFEKRIFSDPVLISKCQKIEIKELETEDAVRAMKVVQNPFEEHHNINIPDELLRIAVELSTEYIKDNFLPGKAIDILDEACALAGMKSRTSDCTNNVLEESDIAVAISKRSGIPIEKISRKTEKFRSMEDELRKKIIGQDEAIRIICDRIKLFMTGFIRENRPLGVLFFAGPTGVGKTELARVVANYLFGSESHFFRFDMSEYSQSHELSRLIGAPPGYIGHEEEGQLTSKVRREPYCVILLDELEKAHSRISDIFLQVFDAGRLTDGKGNTVDFRNTLIIMTSNLGSDLWDESKSIGFRQKDNSFKDANILKEKMNSYLKERFSPEFVNRIDEVVLFRSLDKENIKAITCLIIKDWMEKSKKQGVEFSIEDNLLEHLFERGYSKEFGVRNMKRAIENHLIVPLSKKIIEGAFNNRDRIVISIENGELKFRKTDD